MSPHLTQIKKNIKNRRASLNQQTLILYSCSWCFSDFHLFHVFLPWWQPCWCWWCIVREVVHWAASHTSIKGILKGNIFHLFPLIQLYWLKSISNEITPASTVQEILNFSLTTILLQLFWGCWSRSVLQRSRWDKILVWVSTFYKQEIYSSSCSSWLSSISLNVGADVGSDCAGVIVIDGSC